MKYTKFICHRLPERTFSYKNHYFPVCARCTGFYAALLVIIILDLFYEVHYSGIFLLISVILLIPVTVDGFTQLFKLRTSNNLLRFVTGFIGGFGLMNIIKFFLSVVFSIF